MWIRLCIVGFEKKSENNKRLRTRTIKMVCWPAQAALSLATARHHTTTTTFGRPSLESDNGPTSMLLHLARTSIPSPARIDAIESAT